jgi:hypothetical protein
LQHPEQYKPSPSRPSLLSETASHDREHTRILGSVAAKEHPKSSSNIGKKSLVWLLLGGVAITAAWGLINRAELNAPTVDKYIPAGTPPVAATGSSAPAAPGGVLAATPSAATIINVDEKASSPLISSTKEEHQEPLVNLPDADTSAPSNTHSAAVVTASINAPVKTPVAVQPMHRTEPVKVALERNKPAPALSSKSIDPIDNDVSLISALVAHTEAESQPTQASAQNHSKHSIKKTTQDIVERHAGDNTAALIKRCKRLGGAEARLCQRRICTGHGTEAACKAK